MIEQLKKPALVLDKSKCIAHIQAMQSKIDKDCIFRPHFKTHFSDKIAQWYQKEGIKMITVSSMEMAKYFASRGWQDITIAFPFNRHWLKSLNKLCKKHTINIVVEDAETLKHISRETKYPVSVFIKTDTGHRRTGIDARNYKEMDSLIDILKNEKKLYFKGFLAHAGHSYHSKNKEDIKHIYFDALEQLLNLRKRYESSFPNILLSYGDTPSCSIIEKLEHFDEYRPGNFIFYDLMQYYLGTCLYEDIALTLACPVVAKHKERNEIIIHGGAVHLSKDYLLKNGSKNYGEIVLFNSDMSWYRPEGRAFITSLSQEHGVIKADTSLFNAIDTGRCVGVLPIHSCLTVHQMNYKYKFIK